jgi:uncharacterized delta-60 repeat protein
MNTMIARSFAGSLFFFISLAAVAARADLGTDSSFDHDGFAQVDFDTDLDSARDVAVQADGRYVLVGLSRQTILGATLDHAGLARLNTNGSLDEEFGTGGLLALLPGGTPQNFGGADLQSVAIQTSDQKIVAVGSWNVNDGSGPQPMAIRLLPDGSPDGDFGSAGTVLLQLPALPGASAASVAVDSAGGILISGGANNPTVQKGFILRLTADGDLDTDFADGGVFAMENPATPGASFTIQHVIADGTRIVAVGGGEDFVVVRLDAGGVPDGSFSGDGVASFNFATVPFGEFMLDTFEDAQAVAIQPGGRILVAGSTRPDPLGSNSDAVVLGVTPAGAVDSTFGTDGRVTIPDTGNATVYDLVVRSSGDFVAAGVAIRPVQFSADGGVRHSLPGGFPPQSINGLVVLPDDSVVGGGEQRISGSNYQFVAMRLNVTTLGPDPCQACGQLNEDCKITATDALLALQMAVNAIAGDIRADVNGDGKVTASDALTILLQAVGAAAPSELCRM